MRDVNNWENWVWGTLCTVSAIFLFSETVLEEVYFFFKPIICNFLNYKGNTAVKMTGIKFRNIINSLFRNIVNSSDQHLLITRAAQGNALLCSPFPPHKGGQYSPSC